MQRTPAAFSGIPAFYVPGAGIRLAEAPGLVLAAPVTAQHGESDLGSYQRLLVSLPADIGDEATIVFQDATVAVAGPWRISIQWRL